MFQKTSDEETLQEFVKKHHIRHSAYKEDHIKGLEESFLLEQAGFLEVSRIKKEEALDIQTRKQFSNYILLRKQPFTEIMIRIKDSSGYHRNHFYFDGVKLAKKWGNKQRYLVRAPLNRYVGNVPVNVAERAIQAQQEDLTPEVWFISDEEKVPVLIKKNPIQITFQDPILVGSHPNLREHVVLLAVWGEDIKDLEEYLSK